MLRTMMKSKIHRATVTQADLHYVGSVTVDEDLLDAADLLPGELVHIVDVTNGARLETYTIAGERGSGVIGMNGGCARHVLHRRHTTTARLVVDHHGVWKQARQFIRRRPGHDVRRAARHEWHHEADRAARPVRLGASGCGTRDGRHRAL